MAGHEYGSSGQSASMEKGERSLSYSSVPSFIELVCQALGTQETQTGLLFPGSFQSRVCVRQRKGYRRGNPQNHSSVGFTT